MFARKLLPLSALQRVEKSRREQPHRPGLQRGIEALGIRTRANHAKVSAIPSEGPLIVTGNHPVSGDGLALLDLMLGMRKFGDVKIAAESHVLDHPELKPYVIEVNVINPGGLGTLMSLGEANQAGAVIKAILQT